jgi:hypothetical protein
MNDPNSYEIPAAVGKQVAFIKVYKDEQDRQVLVGFSDGTELAIDLEVRSVTSATLYRPSPSALETLERFDEPPSEDGPFSATIQASTMRLR